MPRFSIVIPSYGNAEYLPACLDSIRSQDCSDWEAVVVIDASPDNSLEIAQRFAQVDDRFRIVNKEVNEGPHLARRSGVEAASGDFIAFLDADDELCEGVLSSLSSIVDQSNADIIHFGLICVPDGEVSAESCRGFEAWANAPAADLGRADLMTTVFAAEGGYQKDWNMHHRLFCASLCKGAFASMTDNRLERAEDGYEFFVLASLSQTEVTRNDIVGYKYFLGRGVTTGSELTLEAFRRSSRQVCECYDAVCAFAASTGDLHMVHCAEGFKARTIFSLANEWYERVSKSDKIPAADAAYRIVDPVEFAAHLYRFVRDRAYALLQQDDIVAMRDSDLDAWYAKAGELYSDDSLENPLYREYYQAASIHMAHLRNAIKRLDWDAQRIRIFVSAHKNVDLFDSLVLQPVQVGAKNAEHRFSWAFHDDEGDNISELNPLYCELTTQYWSWKNVDADYYGFCHYRRYFDFGNTEHKENQFGEIIDGFIDEATKERYCLDDASINQVVRGADVVTTRMQDIRSYMGENSTIRSQYDAAPKLFVEDLDRVIDILVARHPEYEQDAKAFLAGHTGRFCNMFIMKKEIFHDYCAWLFPLLEEFVASADMSLYSKEGLRTPGHLAERLLNIYLLHHERIGAGWKMKQLQCVHFTKPDKYYLPMALSCGNDNRPVIPVVFASDNNYVPMVTTTIYSMLKNASDAYRYDIVVLHEGIEWENQEKMKMFLGQFENAGLQFCDVSRFVDQYELTTNNPHISNETYYRFLIQELLPYYSKVLYLDSDLIVKGDVSELFSVDLGDNLLAAVRDVDYCGNLNMKDGIRMRYTKEVLGMHQPYDYFQAGVLVLNTRAMRKLHPMEKWLEFASDDRYIYNDQDILNVHCQGRVKYLDYDWNVMTDCYGRIGRIFSFAPAAIFDAFNDSRNHEKIVHYAGAQKPWKVTNCDRFGLYWEYAKDTPFYVQLTDILHTEFVKQKLAEEAAIDHHESAVSEDSPLRKVIDPIAPFGSRRREVLKSIGRAVRGLK